MRYQSVDHGIDLCKPADGYVRTPGIHASDIYNAFYKDLDPKRYDKRDLKGEPTGFDLVKMELGLCFEERIEEQLEHRWFGTRPGEYTAPHDGKCPHGDEPVVTGVACPHCAAGTIFSPDFLFEDGPDLVLGELKCSYYSTKGAPVDPKFAKWHSQIRLYCHWLGLQRARLLVLFVCGNYAPPSPQLLAWDFRFTTQELQDEYNVLIRHARKKGLLVGK